MRGPGGPRARESLRALLVAVLLIGTTPLAAATPSADCTGLDSRAVRWIVPSKPGGSFDAYSRLLQPFLEARFGTRVVIDNRPEAGGLVAALALRDAPADGHTLGILNAPGLLTATAVGLDAAPDPATDLTILARVAASHYAMYTGRDSGFGDIGTILAASRRAPALVGVRDAGSSNFLMVPVTASLIGLDIALVSGYVGSTARTMAALRGEVDLVVQNTDAARRYVESGELIPLLYITNANTTNGVPRLTGMGGLALQRAAATGRSVEQARREVDALSDILATGRIVVAPPALPESLSACLAATLNAVLQSAELRAAAERAGLRLAPAGREVAKQAIAEATTRLRQFQPLLQSALGELRD